MLGNDLIFIWRTKQWTIWKLFNDRCTTCANYTLWKGCIGGCYNPPKCSCAATSSCCGLFRRGPKVQVILGTLLRLVESIFINYQLKREAITKGENYDNKTLDRS